MNTLLPYFAILCSVLNCIVSLPLFPIQFPLLSSPPPPLRAPVFSPSSSFLNTPLIEEFYPINLVHSYVPSKDISGLFGESLGDYYYQAPKQEKKREPGRGQGYRHGPRYPYDDDDEFPYYGPPAPYGDDYDGPYGPHGPPRSHGSRGQQHGGRKYHGPPRHHRNRYEDGPHQYGPQRDRYGPGPDPESGKHQDYVLPRDRHREYYGPPSDEHPRAFSHSHHYKEPISEAPSDSHPCPSPPCDDKQQASKVESHSIPLNAQLSPEQLKPGQTLGTPQVTHFVETAHQQ